MREISAEIPQPPIVKFGLMIIYLKIYLNVLETNELKDTIVETIENI